MNGTTLNEARIDRANGRPERPPRHNRTPTRDAAEGRRALAKERAD